MSRVYFHSPSGDAELQGSERAWLGGLVDDIAKGVLNIRSSTYRAESLSRFINPDGPVAPIPQRPDFVEWQQWCQSFELWFSGSSFGNRQLFAYAGEPIDSFELQLNTAITVGDDAVKLAARIHAQCEIHGWVDGPNRAWLADIIHSGLDLAIYRPGLWYVNRPCDGPSSQQPDRRWSDQGWGAVIDLLRSRDDEEVVMSYSVCDQFPDRAITDWEPPPMPEGYAPNWADTDEAWAEWERDYPTPEDKAAHYHEHAGDLWYDLPDEDQWRLGLEALRREPEMHLELQPDNFATARLGHGLSLFDLFAHDADERVMRALGVEAEVSA